MLKKPFQLGKLTLPSNIFCAPLAGCSDLPFRQMTSSYRPGLVFCEMVKMDALVRHDSGTLRMLDYKDSMHPIGAQLCGSKAHLAAQSARMIEEMGFDVLDLNCGCPVDKVTKDGSGSGLLKTPDLFGEIISNMVAAVSIPVTVKIRAGWDQQSINAVQMTQIAEKAGAKAICIHGRTRAQAYQGPANWDWIKECKQAAQNILVIGNGDLFDALSVEKMFQSTGCDAVLIARGTMGQPWIIEDVYRHLSGLEPEMRTGSTYKQALIEHFNHIVAYQPERKVITDMRRVGCWYLKKGHGIKKVRDALNHCVCVAEIRELITNYAWV